ncbi:MAG: flavin reductase family protein [Lachnospiraceae bacterium]|jgi:flavin reductase (DIM6/NTAB) family NADH-FMN oxidoreductase RutF|nr:flavin reductase family protein [Lachnospiraceae bacterium]GFI17917.1 flavoredoxin [Lachnospiraceae bacterium]
MGKQSWKPGNMLYPVPAVLVTAAGLDGKPNVFTVAWTGTVCSDPAMVSISVRPERYSHHMIEETGEFVINLTTRELAFATDYCGVKSGKDTDKIKDMHLTLLPGEKVKVPLIKESPVNIECRVVQTLRLGTHDMYLAKVEAVHAEEAYMDEGGRFMLDKADPIAYSHGSYFTLGEKLGTFGWSVRKSGV